MDERRKIRQEFLTKRDSIQTRKLKEWSEAIKGFVLSHEDVMKADVIFSFIDFKSEVKTREVIESLLKIGKRVAVPKVDMQQKVMHAIEIKSLEELSEGVFGILEPKSFQGSVKPEEIGIVLVPGAVFDKRGFRIGYGGGFYDKFLSNIPSKACKLGICFSFQIVERIKEMEWDIPVDFIISEMGITEVINRD